MEHVPTWLPLVAGFLLTFIPSDRVSGSIRKLDKLSKRATQAAGAIAAGRADIGKVGGF